MASLATVGTMASVAGTVASAAGTIASGKTNVGLAGLETNQNVYQARLGASSAQLGSTIARAQGALGSQQTAVAGNIQAGNIEFSSVIQAKLAQLQGRVARQVSEFEAKQYDMKAKEERAIGQREMFDYRRQTELALSDLQANAAASGFTATDATALDVAGDLSTYGRLQERLAMYGGEVRAEGFQRQAAASRVSGRLAQGAGQMEAIAARSAGRFEANSVRRAAGIEASSIRTNAKIESAARLAEAAGFQLAIPGYKALGKAKQSAIKTQSGIEAATTLLGGASRMAVKYG